MRSLHINKEDLTASLHHCVADSNSGRVPCWTRDHTGLQTLDSLPTQRTSLLSCYSSILSLTPLPLLLTEYYPPNQAETPA